MIATKACYLHSTAFSNPETNPAMHKLLNQQSSDNQLFVTKCLQALHLRNILQTNLKIFLNNRHI